MDTQQEKRKFSRLNTLVDVSYSKHPNVDKEKISLVKNISKGGVCLIAYEEIKEQDILDLKIYLPEESIVVNAVGRVVWVQEFIIGDVSKGKRFDMGVEFIEISDLDLNRINKFVFSHL